MVFKRKDERLEGEDLENQGSLKALVFLNVAIRKWLVDRRRRRRLETNARHSPNAAFNEEETYKERVSTLSWQHSTREKINRVE